MLDKQIKIFSVDTGNFYSNKELYLHKLNHKIRIEQNALKATIAFYDKCLLEIGFSKKDISYMQNGVFEKVNCIEGSIQEFQDMINYFYLYQRYVYKREKVKKIKNRILLLLENKINANIESDGKHHIRKLRFLNTHNQSVDYLDKNIISVFDSSFTRVINAKQDELSTDFMVVQVYYFNIIKDLIYFGFIYNGEKYRYFTSSAGQIRTKKCVFVKESVWKKHEKTIMCGLTIDDINIKGGNNPNKYLAYMALNNSATDIWTEFDIDKTIVIDDFETKVFGTYDLVDDIDYSIKRISDYVSITHSDGSGMILPTAFGKIQKNSMVRIPWVKGLLALFDYVKFIKENNCSPIIKDIYGVEHDVIAEEIQVIFTKSQFKMYKHYSSWEQYKEFYKKYNCSAGRTNIEEDRIKDAKINYQMLQTLTDITDDEIQKIAQPSINKLKNLCSSVENIKEAFGITPYNTNKNSFQQAVELYPNLLNDEYVKSQLREIKDSMIKKYKSGKLQIHGKYTFIVPDLYAACEYWFMNIKEPKGLLNDGEVFCWLFRKSDKLDCLRSPHLYKEHAIRKNMAYYKNKEKQKKLREWFGTDAIYTSCHDLISKILQFDCDGDMSLVISDKTLIKVAERNMLDIVPLYYNMKKASPTVLNNETIYNGLIAAFTGGNIGLYSNDISKIWNSEVFVSGTDNEKQEAINLVKLLCMENNYVIDYAKTLYKPQRPKCIHKQIISHTKEKVPFFFKYAKNKNIEQVSQENNSLVNKLNYIIPNPRINFRNLKLDEIDYTVLMKNPNIECKVAFTSKGKLIKEKTDPLIIKYCELNSKHHFQIGLDYIDKFTMSTLNSQTKQDLKYKKITNEIKLELSQFGYTEQEITDILVKFLYSIKKSKYKVALWLCYGDYILNNIKNNGYKSKLKEIQCIDCGDWVEVNITNKRACRCSKCQIERNREYEKIKKRKQRQQK